MQILITKVFSFSIAATFIDILGLFLFFYFWLFCFVICPLFLFSFVVCSHSHWYLGHRSTLDQRSQQDMHSNLIASTLICRLFIFCFAVCHLFCSVICRLFCLVISGFCCLSPFLFCYFLPFLFCYFLPFLFCYLSPFLFSLLLFAAFFFSVLLAPKELYTWYCPMTIKPLFEHTPVLNDNFEHLCHDDFGDCDYYDD